MLEYLKGPIVQVGDNFIVVEVGGIGLKATVTQKTIEKLRSLVEPQHAVAEHALSPPSLLTYLHISENKWEIFGFGDKIEREAFLLLLECRGVGTKAAINILNNFSPSRLRQIALGEEPVTVLQQAPGIGAKSADRILVELKEKLPNMGNWEDKDGKSKSARGYTHEDLFRALRNLGYRTSEIQMAIANSSNLPVTLAEAVKQLLRNLGKG